MTLPHRAPLHRLAWCAALAACLASPARAAEPMNPGADQTSAATATATATAAATLAAQAAPPLLKFGSFFAQPVGPRGLEIAESLRAADGREVRLRGYMVSQEQRPAGRFLLTPRPVRMSEHADGEADDLPPSTVTVVLDAAQQDRIVTQQDGLIEVVGRLSVGRREEADGRVSWVRLQLGPQAVRAAAMRGPEGHVHFH